MVLFAILTSMNIAEICGLQWKRVNLNEQFTTVDGESLPPLTIAVRAQWYRGEYGSVKAKSRRRNLPIPVALRGVLAKIKERTKFTGPDDPVFAARTGKPVDEHIFPRPDCHRNEVVHLSLVRERKRHSASLLLLHAYQ